MNFHPYLFSFVFSVIRTKSQLLVAEDLRFHWHKVAMMWRHHGYAQSQQLASISRNAKLFPSRFLDRRFHCLCNKGRRASLLFSLTHMVHNMNLGRLPSLHWAPTSPGGHWGVWRSCVLAVWNSMTVTQTLWLQFQGIFKIFIYLFFI